jgi:hypothetical protein
MERGEIFLAIAAKELYIAKRLGASSFNSKTTVSVLDIMCGGDDIISNLEKARFIAAVRTFK